MIAPRPLLFVNSDADNIFPMDGNERVINRLERIYSLFGAGDLVDSVVSIGDHAYRQDIRQAAFRFINMYLKNDPRRVLDTEIDLVINSPKESHPIPPEQLRVFPQESDFPKDAINSRIDQEFVPMAKLDLPKEGHFAAWKDERLAKLRQLTFHHFPDRVPPARAVETNASGVLLLETETPIRVRLQAVQVPATPKRVVLAATSTAVGNDAHPDWINEFVTPEDALYVCEPRGIGASRWTTKNPPNYVERSHYLLGRTADSGRVWDLIATARYLRALHGGQGPVYVVGESSSAVLAVYAALLEPDVDGLVLSKPPATHMDNRAPALLNVLRVCDIPEAIGMVAPRPITILATASECSQTAMAIYRAAGAGDKLLERR
jgi:hypothetical protein